jgi:uncharacterized protein (DUF2141 family)
MKTRLVCLILALGSAVMATAAEPLKITISGLRSDKGRILWMIQDGTTQQHGMTEPANGNAVIEIGGIRSDSVTLYAYHDENSNYRLDRRDDGRPAEGCCSPTIRREELSRGYSIALRYDFGPASPAAHDEQRHNRIPEQK